MFKIVYKTNHYEVYYGSHFICSADSYHEAERDIEDIKERMNKNANKTRKTRFTN